MKQIPTRFEAFVGRLAFVALLLIAGCQQGASTPPEPAKPAATSAASPKLVRPTRGTVQRIIEQPGQVEPFQQTPVHAKIAGFVQKVHVDIGDRVKKGAVLAELWVPEMVEEVTRKRALVEQAKAEIEQAKKSASAAAANVESASAKVNEAKSSRQRADAELERARSQYERLRNKASAVITQEVIDEARLGFEAAKANVAEVEAKVKSAEALHLEAEAKRDKATADIAVADAHHAVAEAERDTAQVMLNYATIPAPFDGVISQRNVDEGHFLQPTAGKAEPLFIVAQTDPVRVFVQTPEMDAESIRDNDGARIRIPALKGREIAGKVTRSTFVLDSRARTLRTEIDLENRDGTLRPGMYVAAALSPKRDNVWTLPASAVSMQADPPFCFRVENGKAVRTPLLLGLVGSDKVEVLKKKVGDIWEGVTGNEEIAASAAGVSDGQAIGRE